MGRPPTCLCGACTKCKRREYIREWYRSHPGYAAAKQKARRGTGAASDYERERWHNEPLYRMKKIARKQVMKAVKRGELVRGRCEVCGSVEVEAHHDDYSVPLGVRWLCPTHHNEHHMKEAYSR